MTENEMWRDTIEKQKESIRLMEASNRRLQQANMISAIALSISMAAIAINIYVRFFL